MAVRVLSKVRRGWINQPCRGILSYYQVSYLQYSTTDEQLVKYPKPKRKWPVGIYGVISRKAAWEIYDEKCELQKVTDAKMRLERQAGTVTGKDTMYMVRSRPYNMYPRTQKHHQFTTKTDVHESRLPDIYDKMDVKHIVPEVKAQVAESLKHVYLTTNTNIEGLDGSVKRTKNVARRLVIGTILQTLLSALSVDNEHLMRSQIDEDSPVETFWRRTLPWEYRRIKPLNRSIRGSCDYSCILRFQFQHRADWQIRTELPLPEFVPRDDDLCRGGNYDYVYDPISMGEGVIDGRPTSVAGAWINDPCEFTSVSIHCLGEKFEDFKTMFEPALSEFKTTVAFFTGFGSCVAQAHNQGFNWLMDVTYPFTTQTVVFDGQNLRICAYQLNTLNLWNARGNDLQNVAWVSDDIKLLDGFENGEVAGLNNEGLEMLIKCLLMEPSERGINLRPFLPAETAPRLKKKFFNHVGEEVMEEKKAERFEYPRDSVYYFSFVP